MTALVHRSRFVDWAPAAITSLAWTPETWQDGEYLAVGRANGEVELWIRSAAAAGGRVSEARAGRERHSGGEGYHYTCERVLAGLLGSSVETILWTHQTALNQDDSQLFTDAELLTRAKRQSERPPRLFTTGLSDKVTEWDVALRRPKAMLGSQGGPVWSLCVNATHTMMAMGCDDGTIRLVDIADGEFQIRRALSKVKGRVMCMDWSSDEEIKSKSGVKVYSTEARGNIISGHSDSSLRLWNVSDGRVVSKMLVDKLPGEHSIVWTVAFIQGESSRQAVSGDSTGAVTFWNLETFSVLQTFRSHAADVLCLAVSPSLQEVYTSGVDRKIVQHRRLTQEQSSAQGATKRSKNVKKTDGQSFWVVSNAKFVHQHDVRALSITPQGHDFAHGSQLLSAGNDLSLTLQRLGPNGNHFKTDPHHKLAYGPSPRQGRGGPVLFAHQARMMACVSESSVSLWSLTRSSLKGATPETPLKASLDTPSKVLEMSFKLKTTIVASALSPNGKYLAISDMQRLRVFKLRSTGGSIKPRKVKTIPKLAATSLHFMQGRPDRLVIGDSEGRTSLWIVTPDDLALHCVLSEQESKPDEGSDHPEEESTFEADEQDPPVLLTSHGNGEWIAALTLKHNILIFNVAKKQVHAFLSASSLQGFPTVMAFHPTVASLVIVFSDNRFIIYNVLKRQLNDWTKRYADQIPDRLVGEGSRVHGIAFNRPSDPLGSPSSGLVKKSERLRDTEFILWGPTFTCRVDLDKPMPPPRNVRQRTSTKRLVNGDAKVQQENYEEDASASDKEDDGAFGLSSADEGSSNMHISSKFRDLIFFDFVGRDEILAVERPYWDIAQSMPGAFWRSGQYGR